MEVVSLMDLSFLTSEEQAIIKNVLKRDTNLKKCDEKRIRKISKGCLDQRCWKLQTGEWFEDLKANRFLDYSSAADFLKCVFQQNTKSESPPSRKIPCLSKIKSFKLIQKLFGNTKDTLDLKRRCHHEVEKNFSIIDGVSTSPCPEEEMNIRQILKDLELMLDQEIKNINSSEEMTDINGFSPVNVMVDKKLPVDNSSHQVWHYPAPPNSDSSKKKDTSTSCINHSNDFDTDPFGIYPGLLNLEVLQENVLPIINTNNDAERGLSANLYACQNEDSIQYAHPCHMKVSQVIDHDSTFVSSRELDKPFYSSPCVSSHFLFPENCLRCDIKMSCRKNCKLEPYQPSRNEEFSCETSLDTESTIEESTIIEAN